MKEKAVLAWRAAMLVALVWIGYELHAINRAMPSGLSYQQEEQLRQISIDTREASQKLQDIERNTRPR
ncbi:hypothetical protein [Roseateles sp. PN1]|uniref:hypothetical protein n=1 Tax=Roseateles sp. PN1 TaxID=3137372 RepID=UPI0031388E5D